MIALQDHDEFVKEQVALSKKTGWQNFWLASINEIEYKAITSYNKYCNAPLPDRVKRCYYSITANYSLDEVLRGLCDNIKKELSIFQCGGIDYGLGAARQSLWAYLLYKYVGGGMSEDDAVSSVRASVLNYLGIADMR